MFSCRGLTMELFYIIIKKSEGVIGIGCRGILMRHINKLSKDWYVLIDETHIMAFCCMCVFFYKKVSRYSNVPAILLGKGWKKMGYVELFLLAVGLSMDAFAVSVCKGLAMKKISFRGCAICGGWFGGFQMLMPMIGYLLGAHFESYIEAAAPWIAFILLVLIGANMIRESGEENESCPQGGLEIKTMFFMAVATSIDALAVGITFALVPVNLIAANEFMNTLLAAGLIGITTFVISCIGVQGGNVFGTRYQAKAEISGGVILILLGSKILLEHFGLL